MKNSLTALLVCSACLACAAPDALARGLTQAFRRVLEWLRQLADHWQGAGHDA